MAPDARLLCGVSLTSLALFACVHRASSKNTRTVPASMLEASRIAGIKDIQPDSPDACAIAGAGERVMAVLELCLDREGAPQRISIVRSSGYGAYDLKLATTMSEWRYTPFLVAGKPSPVCTSVTFIYRPHLEPKTRCRQP